MVSFATDHCAQTSLTRREYIAWCAWSQPTCPNLPSPSHIACPLLCPGFTPASHAPVWKFPTSSCTQTSRKHVWILRTSCPVSPPRAASQGRPPAANNFTLLLTVWFGVHTQLCSGLLRALCSKPSPSTFHSSFRPLQCHFHHRSLSQAHDQKCFHRDPLGPSTVHCTHGAAGTHSPSRSQQKHLLPTEGCISKLDMGLSQEQENLGQLRTG